MNSLSDIKRRLASVNQTRQITGAMETISVAKMRKSLERFEENKEYFDVLFGVASNIVAHADADVKELLKAPTDGKDLVIVVSSDKGLCGAFNHDIFRAADGIINDKTTVMPIGQTALERYSRGYDTDSRFSGEAYAPDYGQAKRIADAVLDMYGNGIRSVRLVYTRLASRSVWTPKVMDILPVTAESVESSTASGTTATCAEFEPSGAEVLKRLIPMYVSGLIYGAFVHSTAAEHSARRAAMSASTKNADEMIESLSLSANRARQGAVTEQITEIIGSTQALGRGV